MAQAAEQHALAVVLDPEDGLQTLHALRCLHARPLGQIVCEPDPTTGVGELALHLLHALGKDPDVTPDPWKNARALIAAEHIHTVVVLRAQLLSYPALRRLIETTESTGIAVWLICPGDQPTHAIRQLLERRAHRAATLDQLTAALAIGSDVLERLPSDHGLDFPILPINERPPRQPDDTARGLRGRARATILESHELAYDWMRAWDAEHPDATEQQAADAVYRLCAASSTASEITVRAHAASLGAWVANGAFPGIGPFRGVK